LILLCVCFEYVHLLPELFSPAQTDRACLGEMITPKLSRLSRLVTNPCIYGNTLACIEFRY
jgi:hypothetical protein